MSVFPPDISPLRYTGGQHAFTVVELLIAAGILLLLSLLAIPLGSRLTEHSKAVGCANQMRGVGTAFMLYRGDHNGWFPPGHSIYREGLGDTYEATFRKELIPAYLAEKPYCPAMRLMDTPDARKRYPDEKKRLKELGSYGINAFLLNKKLEALPGRDWDGAHGENRYPYPGNHRMLFIAESTSSGAINAWFSPETVLKGYSVSSRMIAPRHHGAMRLNFMFLDGHIELIAPRIGDNGAYDWSGDFNDHGSDGKSIKPRNLPTAPVN